MILLTGGSGRLGTELKQRIDCVAPSSAAFNILDPKWPSNVDLVIHCAAYTDVLGAETDAHTAYALNVRGTRKMARYPIVYISTEYVFSGDEGDYAESAKRSPKNVYAVTKMLGEDAARAAPASLIIRCLFKPRPFQHPRACVDQWTTGDYVDVISDQIVDCVKWFQAGRLYSHDTIHIGTGKKTTFELASQTRDVEPISRSVLSVDLPRDTSLNLTRFHELKNGH